MPRPPSGRRPHQPQGEPLRGFQLASASPRRHIQQMNDSRWSMSPRLLVLLLLCGLVLQAAGCGRKGQPEPPPGSDYPRTYPSR